MENNYTFTSIVLSGSGLIRSKSNLYDQNIFCWDGQMHDA